MDLLGLIRDTKEEEEEGFDMNMEWYLCSILHVEEEQDRDTTSEEEE